jgi:hypothetical protein
MKSIAYIIGFRVSDSDDRRLENLISTLYWLIEVKRELNLKKNIKLKIIIIEQDSESKLHIPENIKVSVQYLFIHNDGYYNRGWAFNVGYKHFDTDYYFFADGDIIMKIKDIIRVFSSCFEYEAVNPYLNIYNSTEEYVLHNNFSSLMWNDPSIFNERKNTCFSGGIVGLSNHAIKTISGWDERFRGRGWEDYAFTAKINLFLYSTHVYSFSALHLWHPHEINTTRKINRKLNKQYEKYNFYDYVYLIEKNDYIGSPIKYSTLHPLTYYSNYYISNSRYSFAYHQYKHLFRKYGNKRIIFLNLCEQYHQQKICDIHESGDIPESGDMSSQTDDNSHLSHSDIYSGSGNVSYASNEMNNYKNY